MDDIRVVSRENRDLLLKGAKITDQHRSSQVKGLHNHSLRYIV